MLIAHFSDIHVRPKSVLYRDAIDSNQMLCKAIDHVHSLDVRPDLVVITGDIVDYGKPDEYAMAVDLLGGLRIPYLVIPGNHDNREEFRAAFSGRQYLSESGPLNFCVDSHPVRIVGVDSTVPQMHHGEVSQETLSWLDGVLRSDANHPTLILMHHPPFVSGIPYMDEYRCMKPDALGEVLRKYSNVEAVLCGHAHRLMVRRWAGTIVIACPSTATEIALQLDPLAKPQSFLGPHAYMLHLWSAESGLVSHLATVDQQDGPYPFY